MTFQHIPSEVTVRVQKTHHYIRVSLSARGEVDAVDFMEVADALGCDWRFVERVWDSRPTDPRSRHPSGRGR